LIILILSDPDFFCSAVSDPISTFVFPFNSLQHEPLCAKVLWGFFGKLQEGLLWSPWRSLQEQADVQVWVMDAEDLGVGVVREDLLTMLTRLTSCQMS
jgi:hypothetical protein